MALIPLRNSGNYIYHFLHFDISAFSPTVYSFLMFLKLNSDYFPEQHQTTVPCHEDALFYMRQESSC
jgi:hypothetical protein